MKIDNKFTKDIQDWLIKEPKTNDDAQSGALLLQRINPRNAMYRRFVSLSVQRPARILPKIEYELKLHLKYRLDGLTLQEVNRLDRKVVPEAEKIINDGQPEGENEAPEEDFGIAKKLGRRADHEQLPDEIKALWDDNGRLYKDIKALFEELKSMNDLPSCQRYDKLQVLSAMDQKYFKQMSAYDAFVITPDKEDDKKPSDDNKPVTSADAAKAVTSARAYISKNKAKLAKLHKAAHADGASAEDVDAFNKFIAKLQSHVDTLLSADVVTDEMKASLSPFGVVFDKTTTDNGNADTESSETAE